MIFGFLVLGYCPLRTESSTLGVLVHLTRRCPYIFIGFGRSFNPSINIQIHYYREEKGSWKQTMGKLGTVITAICAIALLGAGDVFAAKKKKSSYKTVAVSEGAILTGTIVLKSKPKGPKEFDMGKFPQAAFCAQAPSSKGTKRFSNVVNLGKEHALQDAVVVIEGLKEGKAFDLKRTHVDMKFCDFLVAGGPSTTVGVVSPLNQLHRHKP